MLLAADGVANSRIAVAVGVSVPTVLLWRERYQCHGLAGLVDEPRPGRPRTLDHAAIVTATLKPPPKRLGVTHWSSRLLADRLKISASTVARAWRAYGVQSWRAESFRFSTDPELVGKVTDVNGSVGRVLDRGALRDRRRPDQLGAEEMGDTTKIFSNPVEKATEDYISGPLRLIVRICRGGPSPGGGGPHASRLAARRAGRGRRPRPLLGPGGREHRGPRRRPASRGPAQQHPG
ncbi:helix-turn-helix domain-containing protein [Cellulomonas sp. URHB0016]